MTTATSDTLGQTTDLDLSRFSGMTSDSREVKSGFLFAALPGVKVNGEDFIEMAVESGASAILVQQDCVVPSTIKPDVVVLRSFNVRLEFSILVAQFYKFQPLHLATVTGTNGKTSVACFTQQLWQALGFNAASFGTLGAIPPSITNENISLTTPDPITLHRALRDVHTANCDHLVLEASSHGLEQFRLHGLKITSAAFTNLSRDHIDYHGDMASYLAAKKRLFTELLPQGCPAVLNADCDEFDELSAVSPNVISYGYNGKDIKLLSQTPTAAGQTLEVELSGAKYSIDLPLIGTFQAMNVLCALGIVHAEGGDISKLVGKLPLLAGVPGRLEQTAISPDQSKAVVVDYAHTPDALENAIIALRPHCNGRMIVVFGCGGDRDKGKRPLMGRVAHNHADVAILTDDNPRTEDAASIRQDVLVAAPELMEVGDREEAIRKAISIAQNNDIVLIAGKGHESGQTIGNKIIPFDDRVVTRQAAREIWGSE
jgi:UDP-N-acetylmuramyl-tripeptide synthetase